MGAGASVYAALSSVALHHAPLNNLPFHPIVSVVKSLIWPPSHATARDELVADLDTLRFGTSPPTGSADSLWQNAAPSWRAAPAHPNIVLVVLESVGAEQMLPGGHFDAKVTPELASRARSMVVFPTLYNIFPGTVRSHVPLATGGRSITWGSVFEELTFPYDGPTIASELKKAGYATAVFSAADMETPARRCPRRY